MYALVLIAENGLPMLSSGFPDATLAMRRFVNGTLPIQFLQILPEESVTNLPTPRDLTSAENMMAGPLDRLVGAVRGTDIAAGSGPELELMPGASYGTLPFMLSRLAIVRGGSLLYSISDEKGLYLDISIGFYFILTIY